jgi:DNA repair protein RecN (Recombination protein N)
VLEELHIMGLGVIDDAVLPLAPGFTVVTGETGAGKTMVLEGIHLLAGGRADSGKVRIQAPRALIEGRLLLPPDSPSAQRAIDAGAEYDDDALLVARTVTPEGRSRAYVGGRAVPATVLADVFASQLSVTGQSEQHHLLRLSEQRAALDRFAGERVAELLGEYQQCYAELQETRQRARRLAEEHADRRSEAELLRLRLADVEQVAPQAGEEAALTAELARLEHGEALRAAASLAHEVLSADMTSSVETPDVLGLLSTARRALASVTGHDPALADLDNRLSELDVLASEIATDLSSYVASLDVDPARMAEAQARRAALLGLSRTHGCPVDEVLAWAQRAAQRLLDLDGDGDHLEQLTAREAALTERLGTLADELSGLRRAAASRFEAAVSEELRELAMPAAAVQAHVEPRPADDQHRFGPDGVDDVELLLVPHPGAPPRALHRGASGGELSRVMLAIQVVFAAVDTTPTLVFDEVDSGVGGRAAVEVGRRLARLGRHHQVLCVTHLPQVAAFADTHLRVVKSSAGKVTASGIEALDDAGRVTELSRMLAGQEASASAQAHAQELLAMAAQERADAAGQRTAKPIPAATSESASGARGRAGRAATSESAKGAGGRVGRAATSESASGTGSGARRVRSSGAATGAKPGTATTSSSGGSSRRGRRKGSREAAA